MRMTYIEMEKKERLACGKCGFIFYQNLAVVAGVIPVQNGKLWLLKRGIEPARGLWTYPAGYAELGEDVREAALRETKEETGLSVRLLKWVGVYSYAKSPVVTVVYEARVLGARAAIIGEETEGVCQFSPSEIPWQDLAFRSTRDALKDWIRNIKINK